MHVYDAERSRLAPYERKEPFVVCKSFEELLGNVDGVHLCVPNALHYGFAKAAMEHGRHVLVEKPFTTDTKEAQRLLELAAEKNVVLEVGHIYRFAAVLNKVAELYNAGYFGKVHYINFYWTHFMQPSPSTDVMWDLLPHPLDMYNIITGLWPSGFAGTTAPIRGNKFDEVTFIESRPRAGPISAYHMSWLSAIKRRDIEVIGSKCSAYVKAVDQTIEIFNPDGTHSEIPVVKNNTIRDEALNFIASISAGKSRINTADLGVRTVELILQIKGAFRHYTLYLLKTLLKL